MLRPFRDLTVLDMLRPFRDLTVLDMLRPFCDLTVLDMLRPFCDLTVLDMPRSFYELRTFCPPCLLFNIYVFRQQRCFYLLNPGVAGPIILLGMEFSSHPFSLCAAVRCSDRPGRDSYQLYQKLISEARGSYPQRSNDTKNIQIFMV